jgi:L-alanine-DL-glutamate epimerase-like enolase superfamily enzyme
MRPGAQLPISDVQVAVFTVPTSTEEESDGTHVWNSTTLIVVEVAAGATKGLGYSYGHPAVATVIERTLADVVRGRDAFDVRARYAEQRAQLRNAGYPGIGAHAVSAVDTALWDLKARALDVSLADLLGTARDEVSLYGSGGFCNYTVDQLSEQLAGWVDAGIPRVKMKVGRHPEDDVARVQVARDAIGDDAGLMVDANGAYTVQQALRWSDAFADVGVDWHEEPVSSDDLRGLAHIRAGIAPGISVTAGEYAYDSYHVRDLIHAGAIDCAQADVTRCGGITGFLDVAALCEAEQVDLSAHTAPAVSLAACAAAPRLRHLEHFHDHVRIEHQLFDGVPEPVDGCLRPDRTRPGNGLELRRADAEHYRA